MKHTVEHVLKRLARYAGEQGSQWNSPFALERLNDVRELIYERGDYEGTVEPGCLCIEDCQCVYLPSRLETIRQGWMCNRPMLVRGANYRSLANIGIQTCCSCSADTRRSLQSTGVLRATPKTSEIPFQLWVEWDSPGEEEECASLHVQVVDRWGQQHRYDVPRDSGSELYGDQITDVLEVTKPETKAAVRLHAVAPNGSTRKLLAHYYPEDINPRYRQFRVTNFRQGDCRFPLAVYAKKSFRPLTRHAELVDIESVSALRFGMQALNAQDGNRDDEYVSKVRLMEDQLGEVMQNLGSNEGAVECQPGYSSTLGPRHDPGHELQGDPYRDGVAGYHHYDYGV